MPACDCRCCECGLGFERRQHATDYNGRQPGCGCERPCRGREKACGKQPCDGTE